MIHLHVRMMGFVQMRETRFTANVLESMRGKRAKVCINKPKILTFSDFCSEKLASLRSLRRGGIKDPF